MTCSYGFSRRAPHLLAHEIATVFSSKSWFDFKGLFDVVYGKLRGRKGAAGGEEMMRLRSYEKLQNLVSAGAVEKSGKNYRGLAPGLASLVGTAAALNAVFTARQSASSAAPAAHAAL